MWHFIKNIEFVSDTSIGRSKPQTKYIWILPESVTNFFHGNWANMTSKKENDWFCKLTIGDSELARLAIADLDISLLGNSVRFLVVHEQVGWPIAACPLIEQLPVLLFLEGLLFK